jgi:hypothetical protein
MWNGRNKWRSFLVFLFGVNNNIFSQVCHA